MTKRIANWAAVVDFHCHREDRGYDTVEDLAEPTGVLYTDIEKVLAMALEDIKTSFATLDDTDEQPNYDSWGWYQVNAAQGIMLSEAWVLEDRSNNCENIAILIARNITEV